MNLEAYPRYISNNDEIKVISHSIREPCINYGLRAVLVVQKNWGFEQFSISLVV
jgi:hypothetical protein